MGSAAQFLLIDRHPDWLRMAGETLAGAGFRVTTALDLDGAARCCIIESSDLILISFDIIEENLATFSRIARSSDMEQRFVVMFPLRRTHEKMRIAFRVGAYDCVEKPYQPDELLRMIAEILAVA